MGRERKEPSIEERRSVVAEAFKMATDAQKKRNELINDIMFDFYCYMSDANTPNDAIKCFGDAYRKLYVKCVPCSTVDIIVKFTLAKFKANEAARAINGSSSHIIEVCKGKLKHYKGYIWKYYKI